LKAGEVSALAAKLDNLNAEAIGEAAVAGDVLARSVISRAGRALGLGVVTLLHLFNPERVIIGGGVSQLGALLFEPIRETAAMYVCDPAYLAGVDIVPAVLGADVGLVGGGALVLTEGGTLDIDQAARLL